LEDGKSQWEPERSELQEQVRQRIVECGALRHSYEYRLGDLLLNRMRLRAPVLAAEKVLAAAQQRLSITRLTGERCLQQARRKRCRVLTTVCDIFPIYSQTFVYQELSQLVRHGFDVRLIYSKLDSRDCLSSQFAHLWKRKRRLLLHAGIHHKDFMHYRTRMPERVQTLIQALSEASGMTTHDLLHHANFLQSFSFTRMVEAYRPAYLHSYFFYDRSLMALVAGYLLNIPRGISCYADHLLKDYDLKVVPLHLRLCDIVIATSERIKRELIEIAPHADPNRILVKPNGIDTECFRLLQRSEPAEGAPYRLVSVCRIEPKKGLLDLVEAVSLLRRRGLNLEAHVIGTVDEWSPASRDYKRRLDQRISEHNLWSTIHLEGRQNLAGVLRFLRIGHIFVAPFVETPSGDKDGIPTALLEGMATGLPAVATDAGSITEVIEDGRDGVLVLQHNPLALANAIEALLKDPERRRRIGCEGADKIRRRYDARGGEGVFHDQVHAVLERRRLVNIENR
jgi:colanic acid/amylovoran biosynthesis glycosyltransferase